MSFAEDVALWTAKTKKKSDQAVYYTLQAIAYELIKLSPVGDPALWKTPAPPGYVPGTYRGGWAYGAGAPDLTVRANPDADGGATLDAMISAIPVDAANHVHYFSNSTPYAMELETGYSGQAPYGIATQVALDFQSLVRVGTSLVVNL